MLGGARDRWVEILRIFAILTARGAPEDRKALHDGVRPNSRLGAALCDGGNPAWNRDRDRPAMSERRLAQLLATRGVARNEALVRAARMIAANRDTGAGLDVRSIAWAVLIAVAATATIPQLGFIHEDSGQSFVLDIADLYRAELTIPCAFRAARQVEAKPTESIERVTRRLTGAALAREQAIPSMIERIKRLIEGN